MEHRILPHHTKKGKALRLPPSLRCPPVQDLLHRPQGRPVLYLGPALRAAHRLPDLRPGFKAEVALFRHQAEIQDLGNGDHSFIDVWTNGTKRTVLFVPPFDIEKCCKP